MGGTKESDPSLGYLTRKDTEVKLPRATRVKNKTPGPIQITAEQILGEAHERQEAEIRPPKQKITDVTELNDYRLCKRKEFEYLIPACDGTPAYGSSTPSGRSRRRTSAAPDPSGSEP